MDPMNDPSIVSFGHKKNNRCRISTEYNAQDISDTDHKQDEGHGLLSTDDLNTLSNFSLLNKRDSAPIRLLETYETQQISLAISEKDNALSGNSEALLVRAPAIHLKKKLLVLDLNGLLADIVSCPPKGHKADIIIRRRAIFRRPFCIDFLKFCFERFEVGIWSSRTKWNIDNIIDYLLGDMKHKLLFCWDLSHCTSTSFNTLENKHKPLVFKELRRLWEKYDPELPWERGYYNESNTLLLDDSPYKALLNPAHTAIFPYSYQFQDKTDNALGDGGDLRLYLELLAESDNVQKFVQQHPFGQYPITERSPSWGFYLQPPLAAQQVEDACLRKSIRTPVDQTGKLI